MYFFSLCFKNVLQKVDLFCHSRLLEFTENFILKLSFFFWMFIFSPTKSNFSLSEAVCDHLDFLVAIKGEKGFFCCCFQLCRERKGNFSWILTCTGSINIYTQKVFTYRLHGPVAKRGKKKRKDYQYVVNTNMS